MIERLGWMRDYDPEYFRYTIISCKGIFYLGGHSVGDFGIRVLNWYNGANCSSLGMVFSVLHHLRLACGAIFLFSLLIGNMGLVANRIFVLYLGFFMSAGFVCVGVRLIHGWDRLPRLLFGLWLGVRCVYVNFNRWYVSFKVLSCKWWLRRRNVCDAEILLDVCVVCMHKHIDRWEEEMRYESF